ncbi:hypothetical protein ACWEPR_36835, partial [Streptomyces sp. NPDC004290]
MIEDHVRTNKAMGLHNLPSKSWTVNEGWMLACNLAADLDAWLRLLTLHDHEDLAGAEPDIMRFRLHHLPASPTTPAADGCASSEPGPGPPRSFWPGGA